MEQITTSEKYKLIDKDLFNKLVYLGIIPSEERSHNVGNSNYSKKTIQPWSIWLDYDLNGWDADIVKRILRTKTESGLTETESRIMDYSKIKHICDERIRQLTINQSLNTQCVNSVSFILKPEEFAEYEKFEKRHNKECGVHTHCCFTKSDSNNRLVYVYCPVCGEEVYIQNKF